MRCACLSTLERIQHTDLYSAGLIFLHAPRAMLSPPRLPASWGAFNAGA